MNEQEPTWTDHEGLYLGTVHAGCHCYVEEKPQGIRWYWATRYREGGTIQDGRVDSLEVAKACALRTAEATAVLEFDPQVGQPVRWDGLSGTVLELRGCSTYLIAVAGEQRWVDYVELSAPPSEES